MKKLLFFVLLTISGQCLAVDVHCVAEAVFFEAEGEDILGKAAVAQVIFNRAKDRRYPDRPCAVTKQVRKGVCHFSFRCIKKSLAIKEDKIPLYNLSVSVVKCYVDGQCYVPKVGDSTLYYACSGKYGIGFPRTWDKRKVKFQAKVGNHCFFKEIV